MIVYNDMPNDIARLMRLAEKLSNNPSLFDYIEDKVWAEAREYEQIPNVDNIYINIVYTTLEDIIQRKYGDTLKCSYYINCLDSSFYINDMKITSIADFEDLIGKEL